MQYSFNPQSADLPMLARAIALSSDDNSGGRAGALRFLEAAGAQPRVLSVVRSAIAAGTTLDPTWAGALDASSQIVGAFIESLVSESLFARAVHAGMMPVPLGQRAAAVTLGLNAHIVAEGSAKAITRLTVGGAGIDRKKAVAIVVLSQELFRSISPAAVALFEAELRKAVGKAIDGEMLATIIDGSTPVLTSSGFTDDNARADVRALLDAVNTTGAGSLIFGMAPDVANGASTIDDGKGAMTPTGGSFYGVDAIVTDRLAAGEMVLIDASGLAGSTDGMEIRQYRQATLQFSDGPDSPPNASTVMLSLWQNNLMGMLAETFFGVERMRSNAVAKMTGIDWGSSGDSPA